MKIWFNKVNESRRSVVDVDRAEIHIGREPTNDVVLKNQMIYTVAN